MQHTKQCYVGYHLPSLGLIALKLDEQLFGNKEHALYSRAARDIAHVLGHSNRLRPYHVECTASRPICEVKQRWAWLVLGWGTAWEYQVS